MKTKHFDLDLEIKSINEKGEFTGYGSVFGNEDSYGDVVMKGAFKDSLKERTPALLWQHDQTQPIGVWKVVKEDDNGLYMEGKLSITEGDKTGVAKADEAHRLLTDGAIKGLSIGYTFESSDDWEYDKEKNVFKLHRIKLYETSLVTFPANEKALVVDVKSMIEDKEIPPVRMIEDALREAGASRSQRKKIMHDYKHGTPRDAELLESAKHLTNLFRGES